MAFYFIFAINASNFNHLKAFTLYLSRLGVCLLRVQAFLFFHRRVYRDIEAGGCDCVDSDYSLSMCQSL
jgi:hypothetical protein